MQQRKHGTPGRYCAAAPAGEGADLEVISPEPIQDPQPSGDEKQFAYDATS